MSAVPYTSGFLFRFAVFFSFDNIQTLFKSHRIGGKQHRKVLAIVFAVFCVLLGTKYQISNLLLQTIQQIGILVTIMNQQKRFILKI